LDCKECQFKGERVLDKRKLKYTDASGSNPQNPSERGMLDGVGAAAAATHADEVWVTDPIEEESAQPAAAAGVVEAWIADIMEEESEQPAAEADAGYIWITDLMDQSEQPAQSEADADAGYIWITDLMEEESAQPTSLEDMSTEDLEAFLALANQE